MAKVMLGAKVIPLIGGYARQKALASPEKRAKAFSIRGVPRVSQSGAAISARLALARAGMEMRGRPYEEVVANVIRKTSGIEHGGRANAEARKRARYARADANVARMAGRVGGRVELPGMYE